MKCFLYLLLIYLLNTNASKHTYWSVAKKHTLYIPYYTITEYNKRKKISNTILLIK